MAKFDFLQKLLIRYFEFHGGFIARHPVLVLLLALVAAALMSSGIVFIQFDSRTEDLFLPINSRALDERATVEKLFPVSYDDFYPARITAMDQRQFWVIVTAKGGGSVLAEAAVDEVLRLDGIITTTVAVDPSGDDFDYGRVCARRNGACTTNPIIEWWERGLERNYSLLQPSKSAYSRSIPAGPVMLLSGNLLVPQAVLANRRTEGGNVVSADALCLFYHLRNDPPLADSQSEAWEDAVAARLDEVLAVFQDIEVVYYTSDSLDESQSRLVISILPYFCVTYGLLTAFSVLSCLMADWVASKPWLANAGILSVFLATGSTIGLLSFIGVPVNQVVASMPFLILGIGLDDMFIMVAAWRRTSRLDSVEKRMSETLSEAAVSITITTLTDFCAFCIGSLTPLPAVRTFCLYTGVAVLMDFLFQVTLFAAFMVFTGRREAQNRHCYTCRQVLPRGEAPSAVYAIFCSGGTGKDRQSDNGYPEENDHALMSFFKNTWAPIITNSFVMGLVIFTYAIYAGASVFGCTRLTEGLDLPDLAEEGSMTNSFYDATSKYFPGSCPYVTVMITERLDYWEPDVQDSLDELASQFQKSRYITGKQFWLDDFRDHAPAYNISLENRTATSLFLREGFLQVPAFERYRLDINVDDYGDVSSSRFILTTGSLLSSTDEAQLMIEAREIADGAPSPLTVAVFAPTFAAFEQYLIVTRSTLMNLSIALLSMLVISFLLIPSVPVVFLVTFCVLSIEIGVIGFMALWGISLNGISMINVILCIGFSVDFSAHICYAVVAQEGKGATPREKVANALHGLGYPILQSGASTMLSLLPLLATKSYIFQTFAKIILLVMGLGVAHGLIVLPVLLTVIGTFTNNGPEREVADGTPTTETDKNGKSTSPSHSHGRPLDNDGKGNYTELPHLKETRI